ncbi:hypothetical protein JCM8547_004605 [Rhodosporidiobolus lusitaniae]
MHEYERPAPDATKLGTLQERLARLNLKGEQPQSGAPPTSSPSSSSVQTGARQRISDKISAFQSKAEVAPLLPEGGSFGFAAPRKSAGGASSKDRTGEKPRVASLGGGRAAVPLDVVKARSASGSPVARSPTMKSETGSAGSGSREGSRHGSSGGEDVRPATPLGEATPVPSPSASTTSLVEKPPSDLDETSSLAIPSGARTPGAASVSSMRVETGSLADEGAAHNPADIDETPVDLAADPHSPLSSPVLAAVAAPSSSVSVASSEGIISPSPTPALAKAPLTSLRAPSRAGSIASLSSMAVEAPSEDVADLSEVTVETPTGEPAGLNFGAETPPADEEQRASRVKTELQQYERDEADPVAAGSGPARSEAGDAGEAMEPPPVEGEWDENSSVARPETPVASKSATEAAQEEVDVTQGREKEVENEGEQEECMPKLHCSDCGAELDILELADHACAPSQLPPALTSPPASPQAARTSTLSPSPSTRSIPDVPQEPQEPEPVAASSPSPAAAPNLSRSDSHHSQRSVPAVPEDVPEDIVDDYYGADDEDTRPARSVPAPQDLSVPEDVLEDELTPPIAPPIPLPDVNALPSGFAAGAASSTSAAMMARSASTPGAASHLRAQKVATGPRSHSVYDIPGRYYSSDDEDGYVAGTATILK